MQCTGTAAMFKCFRNVNVRCERHWTCTCAAWTWMCPRVPYMSTLADSILSPRNHGVWHCSVPCLPGVEFLWLWSALLPETLYSRSVTGTLRGGGVDAGGGGYPVLCSRFCFWKYFLKGTVVQDSRGFLWMVFNHVHSLLLSIHCDYKFRLC